MNQNAKQVAHDALDKLLAKLPANCDLFDVAVSTQSTEADTETDTIETYRAEITVDAAGVVAIEETSHRTEVYRDGVCKADVTETE